MLSEEVYERLKRIKRPGESFSDVINRLLRYRPRLMEIAGSKTISIKEWEEVKRALKDREKLDEIKIKYLLELTSK